MQYVVNLSILVLPYSLVDEAPSALSQLVRSIERNDASVIR